MPAPLRLIPIHNIPPIPLAPLPRRITIVAPEPTNPNRQLNPPSRRIDFTLPIEPRRRNPRVREPVEHDVVENLIFGEDALLDISIFVDVAGIRPIDVLLVDPGRLRDGGVCEAVAEGLWASGLLERVAAVAGVADAVVVEGALLAFFVLDWGEDFFLRGRLACMHHYR